jgi:hypothetical protein
MPSRRNSRRNGPVSRLFSPVNEGLKFVTNAGMNVLNVGKRVIGSVGHGSRRVLGRATGGVNSAGRRLLTGKRRQGGGRRRKTRKAGRKH